VAAPYATLLKEFVDLFQPIPTSLSQERKMAHTILLVQDGKIPFRTIYQLSLLEVQKAKN